MNSELPDKIAWWWKEWCVFSGHADWLVAVCHSNLGDTLLAVQFLPSATRDVFQPLQPASPSSLCLQQLSQAANVRSSGVDPEEAWTDPLTLRQKSINLSTELMVPRGSLHDLRSFNHSSGTVPRKSVP